MKPERFCVYVCAALGLLFTLGSIGVIDFHVCIKAPGQCAQQKDAT